MNTLSGFVINVFAGRAGLFSAAVLPTGGGEPVTVQVSDLDGEPERFNERLTKARLFQLAMERANPVTVIYTRNAETGNQVESVRLLTRDHLGASTGVEELSGLVLSVTIREVHQATDQAELSDRAEVVLLSPVGTRHTTIVALQRAERGVASAMLDLLREAQAGGEAVRVQVMHDAQARFGTDQWIVAVQKIGFAGADEVVDGFVESVGLRSVGGALLGVVLLTTAPPLEGPGRTAALDRFDPRRIVAVAQWGSPLLRMLLGALDSGQRVRIGVVNGKQPTRGESRTRSENTVVSDGGTASADPATAEVEAALLTSVAVLAPLGSAARPVWIRLCREAMEAAVQSQCTPGLPTSELHSADVAAPALTHKAAWEGLGCFNHGVYRIQVVAPTAVRILLDGRPLSCVSTTPLPQPERGGDALLLSLGHACLGDLHTLRIEADVWRGDYSLDLDVYKLR